VSAVVVTGGAANVAAGLVGLMSSGSGGSDSQERVPVTANGGAGRGGAKLGPDPAAEGPHTTFKRDPQTGKVTSHAEWDGNGMPIKRTDITSKTQHGIKGSHTHEYGAPNVNPRTGEVHPGREIDIVPARPEELPK